MARLATALSFIFMLALPTQSFVFDVQKNNILQPSFSVDPNVKQAFGQSLLWRDNGGKKSLIVGHPHANDKGAIFSCSMDNRGQIPCQKLEIGFNPSLRKSAAFGTSLAAASASDSDQFLSCAPMNHDGSGWHMGECYVIDILKMSASGRWNPKCTETDVCILGLSSSAARLRNGTSIFSYGAPAWEGSRGAFGIWNDFDTYYKDVIENSAKKNDITLLGISVASTAKFDGSFDACTAAGAPAAASDRNLNGSVQIACVRDHTPFSKDRRTTVIGPQLFSYFGFTVAWADVNGDGDSVYPFDYFTSFDDLIVAAPMYRKSELSKHRQALHDSTMGAVFVLINQKAKDQSDPNPFVWEPGTYTKLENPIAGDRSARFGWTITNLGDINNDGKEDFAVASVQYNQQSSHVFVYLGTETGLIEPPAQIIDSPAPYRTFGFSMTSGKFDFTRDGHPDLAVGAPYDDKVVIFQSRPVTKITVVTSSRAMHQAECGAEAQQITGFKGQVKCFSFQIAAAMMMDSQRGQCFRDPPKLRLMTKLYPSEDWLNEFETSTLYDVKYPKEYSVDYAEFMKKWNLFYLNGESDASSAETTSKIAEFWFRNQDHSKVEDESPSGFRFDTLEPNCVSSFSNLDPASMAKTKRVTDKNMYHPAQPLFVGMKWRLDDSEYAKRPADMPVADPRNNTAIAKLMTSDVANAGGQQPTTITSEITSNINREDDEYVIYLGDETKEKVEIHAKIRNSGNRQAHGFSLLTSFDSEALFLKSDAVILEPGVAFCGFAETLMPNEERTCVIEFGLIKGDLHGQKNRLAINSKIVWNHYNDPVTVRGSATHSVEVKVKLSVNVRLDASVRENQYSFSGKVSGTLGYLSASGENHVGSSPFTLQVSLENQKDMNMMTNSTVVIDWPYEIADDITQAHGKYMGYIVEAPRVVNDHMARIEGNTRISSVVCDSTTLDKIVNIYGKTVLQRRDSGIPVSRAKLPLPAGYGYPPLVAKPHIDQDSKADKTARLSCYNGQLRCRPIVCHIGPLKKNQGALKLLINFRIWDDTLRMAFGHVDEVNLQFSAVWKARTGYDVANESKNAENQTTTLTITNLTNQVKNRINTLFIGLITLSVLLALCLVVFCGFIMYKGTR